MEKNEMEEVAMNKRNRIKKMLVLSGITMCVAMLSIGCDATDLPTNVSAEENGISVCWSSDLYQIEVPNTIDGAESSSPTGVIEDGQSTEGIDNSTITNSSNDGDFSNLIGRWTLEVEKTDASNEKNLFMSFGSNLRLGFGMIISEDGSFVWWIAAGHGGTGTWHLDNSIIRANVYTHERQLPMEIELEIRHSADGSIYLVMNYCTTLVWVKDHFQIEINYSTKDVIRMSYEEIFTGFCPIYVDSIQASSIFLLPWDNEVQLAFHHPLVGEPIYIVSPVNRIFVGVNSFEVYELQELFRNFTYRYNKHHETLQVTPWTGMYIGSGELDGWRYDFLWRPENTTVTTVMSIPIFRYQ